MEEGQEFKFKTNVTPSSCLEVRGLLEKESWSCFKEIEVYDVFSWKYRHGEKKATEAQRDTLNDTTKDVWSSLGIHCKANTDRLVCLTLTLKTNKNP
jgi:hypothetical protein